MGYLTLGILGLTVLALLFGFLAGIIRGRKRSILRSIIIIVCIAIAFLLRGTLIDIIKSIKIEDGKNITDLIREALSGEEFNGMEGVVDQVMLIVDGLLATIVYLLSFVILRYFTLVIVYPICKIFVKKPPFGRKKRLGGIIVSMAMSLIICVTAIGPLAGLLYNVSNIAEPVMQIASLDKDSADDLKETKKVLDEIGLTGEKAYGNSTVGKLYKTTTGWYYRLISSSSNESGDKTDLDTQLGALGGVLNMAGSVMDIVENTDIERVFNGTASADEIEDFKTAMQKLDEAKDKMSPAEKEKVNALFKESITPILQEAGGEDIDLSDIDFNKVVFADEAEVFLDIAKISQSAENGEEITDAEKKQIVKDIAKSEILLSFTDSMVKEENGIAKDMSEQDKALIEDAISEIEDKAKAEKIKKLFFGKPTIVAE